MTLYIIMSASPLHRALGLVTSQIPETTFEFYSDAALGVAFLATAIIAAKRWVQIYISSFHYICAILLWRL